MEPVKAVVIEDIGEQQKTTGEEGKTTRTEEQGTPDTKPDESDTTESTESTTTAEKEEATPEDQPEEENTDDDSAQDEDSIEVVGTDNGEDDHFDFDDDLDVDKEPSNTTFSIQHLGLGSLQGDTGQVMVTLASSSEGTTARTPTNYLHVHDKTYIYYAHFFSPCIFNSCRRTRQCFCRCRANPSCCSNACPNGCSNSCTSSCVGYGGHYYSEWTTGE